MRFNLYIVILLSILMTGGLHSIRKIAMDAKENKARYAVS